jgi:hypothetical protein
LMILISHLLLLFLPLSRLLLILFLFKCSRPYLVLFLPQGSSTQQLSVYLLPVHKVLITIISFATNTGASRRRSHLPTAILRPSNTCSSSVTRVKAMHCLHYCYQPIVDHLVMMGASTLEAFPLFGRFCLPKM